MCCRSAYTTRQHGCTKFISSRSTCELFLSTFKIVVGPSCCLTKLTVWPAHCSDGCGACMAVSGAVCACVREPCVRRRAWSTNVAASGCAVSHARSPPRSPTGSRRPPGCRRRSPETRSAGCLPHQRVNESTHTRASTTPSVTKHDRLSEH